MIKKNVFTENGRCAIVSCLGHFSGYLWKKGKYLSIMLMAVLHALIPWRIFLGLLFVWQLSKVAFV